MADGERDATDRRARRPARRSGVARTAVRGDGLRGGVAGEWRGEGRRACTDMRPHVAVLCVGRRVRRGSG